MSKLIFNNVFNIKGFIRALEIVKLYYNFEQGSNLLFITVIAERLLLNAQLPLNLREFFFIYSLCIKSPTKSFAIKFILALYEKYKLYNLYL
jgi:hypothetical protein